MQLAVLYQNLVLLPEGSAAVPLNRLGQEDGLGQRPHWLHLKHLSAGLEENNYQWMDHEEMEHHVWRVAVESSQFAEEFCRFFFWILGSAILFFRFFEAFSHRGSESSSSSSNSYSSMAAQTVGFLTAKRDNLAPSGCF